MREFFNILSIAIALSMDTFSLSLSLGTYNISYKKIFQIALTVGLMHFLMPLFGDFLGEKIITFFSINSHIFLGSILLFLAFNLLYELLKKEEKVSFDLSFLGIFLFSFGVSIDAFSTGLGLNAITTNQIFAMVIFAIVSFSFTLLGLWIGRYASSFLGKKATVFGLILLFILAILHLCS